MKLKCNDGKVREFILPKINQITGFYDEAYCNECDKEFGTHDTYLLKPLFLKHICKIKKEDLK